MIAPVLLFVAIVATADESGGDSGYLNVYGEALQPCSYDGMALTGYTRSGYCVDQYDDSGSHHICIDLSSLGGSGGNEDGNDDDDSSNRNFCNVTGQYDWCSSQDMPCHEDPDTAECPVTNWCVCQWAFASYIEKSGGCENIQTVVCESINLQAALAYQKMISSWNTQNRQKYQNALDCLVDRCGISSGQLGYYDSIFSSGALAGSISRSGTVVVLVAAAMLVVGVSTYFYQKRLRASQTIQLNKDDAAIAGGDNKASLPVVNGESKLL